MSDLEPNAQEIVGAERDPYCHIARADSERQVVTILHSHACLNSYEDLRECPFSRSLDRGIVEADWRGHEDRPVVAEIEPNGNLVPFPFGTLRSGTPFPQPHAMDVQRKLNEDYISDS